MGENEFTTILEFINQLALSTTLRNLYKENADAVIDASNLSPEDKATMKSEEANQIGGRLGEELFEGDRRWGP